MIHEKELPFSWFEEHMPLLSPCVRDLPVGVAIKVSHAWHIPPPFCPYPKAALAGPALVSPYMICPALVRLYMIWTY